MCIDADVPSFIYFREKLSLPCEVDTDAEILSGTGTPVGDPIEVDAVGRFFSPREGASLLIGSVENTPSLLTLCLLQEHQPN
jgi:hypothetical protein